MCSMAGLFWRNNLRRALVIPSEQTASSYIILYITQVIWDCQESRRPARMSQPQEP